VRSSEAEDACLLLGRVSSAKEVSIKVYLGELGKPTMNASHWFCAAIVPGWMNPPPTELTSSAPKNFVCILGFMASNVRIESIRWDSALSTGMQFNSCLTFPARVVRSNCTHISLVHETSPLY
jgi:hypothetical protein